MTSPYDVRFATQETLFRSPERKQLPPPNGRQMSLEDLGMAVAEPEPEGQTVMFKEVEQQP